MAKVMQEIPAEWKVTRSAPGTAPWDGWRKFADGQLYALDTSDYEGKPEAQRGKADRWAIAAGYKITQWARHGNDIAVQFEKLSDEDAGAQRVAHAKALKDAKDARAAAEAQKAAQKAAETPAEPVVPAAPVDPFAASTAG